MTARFRQIIAALRELVTVGAARPMPDHDFIAAVDAAVLLCELHDDLGLDTTAIVRDIDTLYQQFAWRVDAKEHAQAAMPLLRALERLIYACRQCVGGSLPEAWSTTLGSLCARAAAEYRVEPLMHSADYVHALCVAARKRGDISESESCEINGIIATYLRDIDAVPVDEQLRRLAACKKAEGYLASENSGWHRWTVALDSICEADYRTLSDAALAMWCEATDQMPLDELKSRARHSRAMQVECLRAQAAAEFRRIAHEKRKYRARAKKSASRAQSRSAAH